jgi:hypothetical protein
MLLDTPVHAAIQVPHHPLHAVLLHYRVADVVAQQAYAPQAEKE